MTPYCNEKLLPPGQKPLQPDYFKSSRKIQQSMHCFFPQIPRAGSWSCDTIHGSPIHGRWQCCPGDWASGSMCSLFFYYYCFLTGALFSGGDGVGWHGARGSPVLARKPDAWSHCLALPGKTGKASAGVIKQHAGAAGSEQPASEVLLDLSSKPLDSKCHCVKPKKKEK